MSKAVSCVTAAVVLTLATRGEGAKARQDTTTGFEFRFCTPAIAG